MLWVLFLCMLVLQVRYAASVATRTFMVCVGPEQQERFLPTLTGPMCLNRCVCGFGSGGQAGGVSSERFCKYLCSDSLPAGSMKRDHHPPKEVFVCSCVDAMWWLHGQWCLGAGKMQLR